MGRVGDEALLRVLCTVQTFQQPVDRVGEIPQLVAASAEGESLVDVAGGDAFKLVETAQARWRAVNAPPRVASRPRRSPLRQRPPGRTTPRIRRRGSSSVTCSPQ